MYCKFWVTNQSEQSYEQTYFPQRFPTCMLAARALNFKLMPAFLCPGVVSQKKWELENSLNRNQEEWVPQLK